MCDSPSQQTGAVQKVCWIHHKHLNLVPADTLGTAKLISISHWKKKIMQKQTDPNNSQAFLICSESIKMMNEKREEKFKVKKQKQSEEAFSPWFNEP